MFFRAENTLVPVNVFVFRSIDSLRKRLFEAENSFLLWL